jgi:hypothetical protein
VRHHPLFAKQRRDGTRSNFSSLLLGENVRIIRRRGPFDGKQDSGGGGVQAGGPLLPFVFPILFLFRFFLFLLLFFFFFFLLHTEKSEAFAHARRCRSSRLTEWWIQKE